MPFINPTFLLHSDAAQRLYDTYAAPQPIIDYHNHLPPKDIAENRRFENLFEIWLEGDHYKWRAMRANGVDERFITGDASPYEKFLAWARTVPFCLRNPLYHWTHLELARYFGIDDLLDETTAPEIWRPGERASRVRSAEDARHPAQVQRHGALHHGRSRRTAALAHRDPPIGSGDQGLPDLPPRSRDGRSRARCVQPVDRQAGRGVGHRHRAARRSARCAARAASGLPRRRRPPLGPWPLRLLRRAVHRRASVAAIFDRAPQRAPARPRQARLRRPT